MVSGTGYGDDAVRTNFSHLRGLALAEWSETVTSTGPAPLWRPPRTQPPRQSCGDAADIDATVTPPAYAQPRGSPKASVEPPPRRLGQVRNYADIHVELAAMQVVYPRQKRLRVTQTALELDDEVRKFLEDHVRGGLADPTAIAANFVVVGDERASGTFGKILTRTEGFVDHSGRLARLLYEASEHDERVSDGTVALLRCLSATTPFVALLKLDPSDRFRTVEDTDPDGRERNRLELDKGLLPGANERLQKAVFVRSVAGQDYDMLLVDRQRPGEVISKFFIQDFLGAEATLDDTKRTETLYRVLTDTKNAISSKLSAGELSRLDSYITGQFAGGHVNVTDLVQNLPRVTSMSAEEVSEAFAERINNVLPDQDFDIDDLTAKRLLKRKRFTGDNGLLVSLPANFFEDMVTPNPPTEPDGYWTVTIRTRRWSET